MTNATTLFRALLIYGLCLPLAIFLGYLLATPLDFTTFVVIGLALFLLSVPILLRWHKPLLLVCWNMTAVVPFLPGGPQMWLLMAGMSLLVAFFQRALSRNMKFLNVPSLTWPLVFLALVILVTAWLTGGISFGAAGSRTGGGKRYVLLLGAIIGYFALTTERIPPRRTVLYVCLYFLGAITAAIGNLAPLVGPEFYFLFYIFPVERSGLQAMGHEIVVSGDMAQFAGLIWACLGVLCAILAVYGIRGLTNLRKGWRLLFFLGAFIGSLYGGFRTIVVIFTLTLFFQFYLERLYRTRLLPIAVLIGILITAALVPVVDKLPFSVQRALSVLPIEVDPMVKYSTELSNQWRKDMWRIVLPEIPKYLLLGKGFALNSKEIEVMTDLEKSGRGTSMDIAIMAGDYHNGPLTLIIPFGIFGVVGFIWFLVASLRALYRNYRYGEADLQKINTFLLAYFAARVIFFCFVFGAFQLDLAIFTGLVGLSVSLNGGVASPEVVPESETATGQLEFAKA